MYVLVNVCVCTCLGVRVCVCDQTAPQLISLAHRQGLDDKFVTLLENHADSVLFTVREQLHAYTALAGGVSIIFTFSERTVF